MKIYFAGSIRAGREDAAIYGAIISRLQSLGEVLTEHVGYISLSQAGEDGADDRSIYDRDMAWLESCDCIVAEVTTPSLGVGYELAWAVAIKKPALCLYRMIPGRRISAMIAGSPGIQTASYASLEEFENIVEDFLRKTIITTDSRA